MIIDMGSGPQPMEDADIHMDLLAYPHVEVLHDMLTVPYPFEDNFADVIYLHEVVEHISIFDINKVFSEVYRILKPGGYVEIIVPDLLWVMDKFSREDWASLGSIRWLQKSPNIEKNVMRIIYGGSYDEPEKDKPTMRHISGWTMNLIKESLLEAVAPEVWRRIERLENKKDVCNLLVQATK